MFLPDPDRPSCSVAARTDFRLFGARTVQVQHAANDSVWMGVQGGGMAGSSSHPGLQGLVNQGPLFAQGQGQLGPGGQGWPGAPLYSQPGQAQQPGAGWDLQSLQHEQVLRAQLELIKGGLDPSIIPQVAPCPTLMQTELRSLPVSC